MSNDAGICFIFGLTCLAAAIFFHALSKGRKTRAPQYFPIAGNDWSHADWSKPENPLIHLLENAEWTKNTDHPLFYVCGAVEISFQPGHYSCDGDEVKLFKPVSMSFDTAANKRVVKAFRTMVARKIAKQIKPPELKQQLIQEGSTHG